MPLNPYDRQLLLNALRPPEKCSLDFAVGTTFSLDLLALLTAPLGFTRFELQENEGSNVADADAHLILRTLREFSDRITLFCQSGRIAVPPGYRPLLAMLEQMVVEVVPPTANRVFHPKVWALRFVAQDGAVAYRLIVLSRNLTFAKSWDTILVLDGELTDRQNAIKANHPLGDFFRALPSMARRGMSDVAARRSEQVQAEIRKVQFECPADVDAIAFHPLGIPGVRTRPFEERIKRLVIVSPFLSSGFLSQHAERGRGDVLVSREDSLVKLSTRDLSGFSKIYVLNSAAAQSNEDAAPPEGDLFDEAAGLHAKCFVADDGWNAHIWTGSANATSAAFSGNVELLVQLTGKASRLGSDALLAKSEHDVGLMDLLTEFTPLEAPECDEVGERLEDLLEAARAALASGEWSVKVEPDEGQSGLRMVLEGASSVADWELDNVKVCPATLSNRALAAIDDKLVWQNVSTEGITSFFVFEVTRRLENRSSSCRFVLNLPLFGAPANRQEVLLKSMLRDRAQLIRFLLLLLGENDEDPAAWRQLIDSASKASASTAAEAEGLLEPLLRALERDPSRLDLVERLLRDLGKEGGDDSPVPPELAEIFQPIWDARHKVAR